MRDWFVKNLGDAMLALDQQNQITERFLSLYAGAEPSTDIAVFMRHESEGQLHCDVKIYFSPNSVAIATEFDATSCAKPSRDGLSVLAGSSLALSALFP